MQDAADQLTRDDIEQLLTSLAYSMRAMREAAETPYEIRQESLSRLEALAAKLRRMRDTTR